MRKILGGLLAACLLTACGANTAATDSEVTTLTLPPTSTASAAPTTPAGPSRNDRNNIVKQLGELASIVDANGNDLVTFTVDSIEVDPPCLGYAQPAENGHLLVLTMRVTTGPDLSDLQFFHIVAEDWQVIGPDGITETNLSSAAAYGCVPESDRLTDSPMGPGQQFVGKIVLDSRNTSGSAMFLPSYTEGGWEWSF